MATGSTLSIRTRAATEVRCRRLETELRVGHVRRGFQEQNGVGSRQLYRRFRGRPLRSIGYDVPGRSRRLGESGNVAKRLVSGGTIGWPATSHEPLRSWAAQSHGGRSEFGRNLLSGIPTQACRKLTPCKKCTSYKSASWRPASRSVDETVRLSEPNHGLRRAKWGTANVREGRSIRPEQAVMT